MKQKLTKIVISIFFIITLLTCDVPWSHHDLATTAILNLSFINNLKDTVTIKYVRPKELLYGDSVFVSDPDTIDYRSDSFTINPQQSITDTITYKFTSSDYCSINNYIVKYLRFTLKACIDDSVVKTKTIYPWDTSIVEKKIESCIYVSYDTLKIP
jgi:hypothetical protein